MAISVAEYLGQRTDGSQPISPVSSVDALCPFNGVPCRKMASSDRKAPVCSVRTGKDRDIYIVCEERLISTKIKNLTEYQKLKLLEVARLIFNPVILPNQIGVKSEVSIKIPEKKGNLKADFIMKVIDINISTLGPRGVILEIQGGGETSNTGTMQRHVNNWEDQHGSNIQLAANLNKVSPIQNNAWKRLQEQMLVKGAIAKETGYGFVACVGSLLYKIVDSKFNNVANLANQNWEIAIIAFEEDRLQNINQTSIPFKINLAKTIFTSFDEIAIAISSQGVAIPTLFSGEFTDLTGAKIVI